MKIGILGGGSWGSALARHLAVGDPTRDVTLWCHNPSVAEEINSLHTNHRFLPDVSFPPSLTATTDLAQALFRADVLLQVSPSHVVRDIMSQAAPLIPPRRPHPQRLQRHRERLPHDRQRGP